MSDFISGYLIYSLVVVALIIIVGGGIYLILRPLVLWYFKIYTIVSEQQETNALLREIRDELRERNFPHSSSRQLDSQQSDSEWSKEEFSKYMPR